MPSRTRSSSERRPIGAPSYSTVPRAWQHAHQRVEQGRLAGAVRADDGDDLAGARGDRQAVQDFGAAVAGVQVADVEEQLGHVAQVLRAEIGGAHGGDA
jgi:hypothetical protein